MELDREALSERLVELMERMSFLMRPHTLAGWQGLELTMPQVYDPSTGSWGVADLRLERAPMPGETDLE